MSGARACRSASRRLRGPRLRFGRGCQTITVLTCDDHFERLARVRSIVIR